MIVKTVFKVQKLDKDDPKPSLITLVRVDALARGYRLAMGKTEKVYGVPCGADKDEKTLSKVEAKQVLAVQKKNTPSEYMGVYDLALRTAYSEE